MNLSQIKKILTIFLITSFFSAIFPNFTYSKNPLKIESYFLDIDLKDSCISIIATLHFSASNRDYDSVFLLFNECAKIKKITLGDESLPCLLQEDTLRFFLRNNEDAILHMEYEFPHSMFIDTVTVGYSMRMVNCSRDPFLYNHWQLLLERYHRWYPLLYDNFADFQVSIRVPIHYRVFAFLPADNIQKSKDKSIYYYTLYDEDFPLFITQSEIYKRDSILRNNTLFNFYYIPNKKRFLEKNENQYLFTNEQHKIDSLFQTMYSRSIEAFFWYSENLWLQDIKEVNIIETTLSGMGLGLGNFILVDDNIINNDFLYKTKISHEISHLWLGLHTKYQEVGRYFLSESIPEYVNLLFFESWAGEEAMEKTILNHKDFKEWRNPPQITVSFNDVLNRRKDGSETDLFIIYSKGPVFLHEFRKLIGKDKFLKIIIDTYMPKNDLINLSDFEENIKRNGCWEEYLKLFEMKL